MRRTRVKKCNILFSLLFIFTLFLVWSGSIEKTYAYTPKSAVTVSAPGVLVETKVSPSISAAKKRGFYSGKPLTLLSETIGDDGYVWYLAEYALASNGAIESSYIRSDFVQITGEVSGGDTGGDTGVTPPPSETTGNVYATAICNGINVNIRSKAGTGADCQKLVAVNVGQTMDVFGETTVGGNVWYNVTCNVGGTTYTGWIIGLFIDITPINVDVSGDFATSLRNAGFPESYIPSLVSLHNKYPNWQFQPVITGLDWNTVIATESVGGRNMVHTTANDSMKSTDSRYYNWNTNSWVILDGSSWVAAGSEYIAYCMDPRNFLNESSIFQFESLSYSPTQNLAGVQAILNGTFMQNNVTDTDGTTLNYADAFLKIGQETNVSPYHLASRVRQEQGAGTSSLISGTYPGYEGYFNYFNFGAAGSGDKAVITNGLNYARARGWNTRYKSLSGGASLLGQNYISVGQDTLYFQKFNVVNKNNLYGHQYMANVTAAITEGQKIATAYSDKSQSFVFKIPVYSNMPATAVAFTASGNPNNYLSSLTISGVTLTPGFSSTTNSYSAIVPNSVSSVSVLATSVASTSGISGTGTYNLAVGNNTIQVKCTSQSGVTNTYTISIVRKGNSSVTTSEYSLKSDKYSIGANVTGIAPGTSATDFLNSINASGDGVTIKVLNASGTETTGKVGTGTQLAVYVNGTLKGTHTVVVYGDVNGDGEVNILDMIKLNRQIVGKSSLSGCYLEAGDANHKGDGINIMDMIVLNNHIIGKSTISQ